VAIEMGHKNLESRNEKERRRGRIRGLTMRRVGGKIECLNRRENN
jgi:hypothetical protein